MKSRVLGLDLSPTSVAFALIDYDPVAEDGEIVRMGVRAFPSTRDAKSATLNQTRRLKRLARRKNRRRRARRRDLAECLHGHGLLPPLESKEWDDVMRKDPYILRREGLSRRLSAHELGRALFHLAKRRHFQVRDIELDSYGKSEDDAPQEDADDRAALLRALSESGETLGEWLANLDQSDRKRGRLATRAVVVDEYNRLLDHQATYVDGHSQPEFSAMRAEVEKIVFFQRPRFWRKKALRTCTFIPDAEPCPSGSWLSQQRRMYEAVNNLAFEGEAKALEQEQRDAIVAAAQTKRQLTWAGVRKALAPLFLARGENAGEKTVRFNLEAGGMAALPGNRVEHILALIFGETWESHPHKHEIRESIHSKLFACDYENINDQRIVILPADVRAQRRAVFAREAEEQYGLTEMQAAMLSAMQLPSGWDPFSVEATKKFLGMLQEGWKMGELLASPKLERWRASNFPRRGHSERRASRLRLPSPADPEERERLKELRNPSVVRVHNEMRKVVNNLLDAYGTPDVIRLKLSRGLTLPPRMAAKVSASQRRNERQRAQAREDFEQRGVTPRPSDLRKWVLWKECGEICPYTGDAIGFNALFGPIPEFNIDHIWPRSRSLDDSMGNKTLCRISENRLKADKTPYEYLGQDPERWVALQVRVEAMAKPTDGIRMSKAKIRRFFSSAIPDGFAERRLADAGYAARDAVRYLSCLWRNPATTSAELVQPVAERGVSLLAHLWGVDTLCEKDDLRRHAVTAIVAACIHPGMTKSLSNYWRSHGGSQGNPTLPWRTLVSDAKEHLKKILVSHKVRKKVSGQLHKETVYGITRNIDHKGYTQFCTRRAVGALSKSELKSQSSIHKDGKGVRDPRLASLLRNHPDLSIGAMETSDGRPIRRVRVTKKMQKDLLIKIGTGHVQTGSNHHVAIFRTRDGAVVYDVVSLFEAARRLKSRERIVRREREGCVFLNSLSRGDSLRVRKGEKQGEWVVRELRPNGAVGLASLHHISPTWFPRVTVLVRKCDFQKLSVDPIGRTRPAGD